MPKAGFAAIIGKPNVGKSTLMNTLIGQKIAITSYKPQTTRNQIRTIYTDENGQIVFLDTPGILKAKDRLGRYMEKSAENAIRDVDVVLWLVEPKAKLSEEDRSIVRQLASVKTPVLILINKIDSVKKAEILPVIAVYQSAYDEAVREHMEESEAQGGSARGSNLKAIIPVSARTGAGTEDVLKSLFELLPEGEPFYDEEQVTTQTEREIAGEIVREKALRLLQEEVPHGIAVEITTMHFRKAKNGQGEICDINADLLCERESHKGIIIGKGGAMLKKIGTAARIDIENMLETKVNLHLFVKVRPGWKDDGSTLRSLGYDEKKLKNR